MKNLETEFYNNNFSHIYIEEKIRNNSFVNDILKKFKNSQVVYINHYKDIFTRKNQDFNMQKKSQKLILAKKEGNFIYKGSELCDNFGNKNFYYTSIMMNCIFDCEYCYLRGMYNSANIVLFVNIEDVFYELNKLTKNEEIYLSISYDSDILALENLFGYARKFIYFTSNNKNLKIEIRTKSANFKLIKDILPNERVIFAWTLLPNEIINKYENKTPSLNSRLENILLALNFGWNVRLCFDPILYIDNFETIYKNFIDEVLKKIPIEKIYDISIGTFRISKEYLKNMQKNSINSVIANYPYKNNNGIFGYDDSLREKLIESVYCKLKNYISEEKIYIK